MIEQVEKSVDRILHCTYVRALLCIWREEATEEQG